MSKRIHVSNGAIVATAESTVALMRDIKKLPTLSRAEEMALAERIQSGDTRAAAELVQANIRFAIQFNIAELFPYKSFVSCIFLYLVSCILYLDF